MRWIELLCAGESMKTIGLSAFRIALFFVLVFVMWVMWQMSSQQGLFGGKIPPAKELVTAPPQQAPVQVAPKTFVHDLARSSRFIRVANLRTAMGLVTAQILRAEISASPHGSSEALLDVADKMAKVMTAARTDVKEAEGLSQVLADCLTPSQKGSEGPVVQIQVTCWVNLRRLQIWYPENKKVSAAVALARPQIQGRLAQLIDLIENG